MPIAMGRMLLLVLSGLRACRRIPPFGSIYQRWVSALIRNSGLFDAAFYLDNNADVEASGLAPIVHYAVIGDRQGRCPSACFDPVFYRAHARARSARAHALLHYGFIGRHRRQSPSAWFDSAYYLDQNKDVARSGAEPLNHFLTEGAIQGRSPSRAFDCAGYLDAYPDVREAGVNPLLHYIDEGRFEARRTRFDRAHSPAPRPWLTAELLCQRLLERPVDRPPSAADISVDVVVPVYRGRLETLRCLLSLLTARVSTGFELIVIDDASPDPMLASLLERLAARGQLTLIAEAANRGFVAAANRGMALHPGRDVVLLNADTEVQDGWLDRLRCHAQRRPDVGTVTPLSNNASLCSYPIPNADNPYPLELDDAALDALAARENRDLDVYSPTAVGFCMYVRRACIDDVGLFDADAFSPGYGEEDDFSQRASRRGWRHRIAADVFVRHWGARSFRGERGRYASAAKAVIARRYPHYARALAAFEAANPLAEARARLDWGRLRLQQRGENVLILHHRRGGGSARRVADEIRRVRRQGRGVYLLRPVPGDREHMVLSIPSMGPVSNRQSIAIADRPALRALVRRLGITEVQTHGLFDLVPRAIVHLAHVVRSLGLRWVAYLHDYKVICPRGSLADRRGRYCGEPGPAGCWCCLVANGSAFGRPAIGRWRAMHGQALAAATSVLAPDRDAARRVQRYLPQLAIEVSANDGVDRQLATEPRPEPVRSRGSGSVPGRMTGRALGPAAAVHPHVVVLGAIGRLKGFDVLLRCARDADARGLRLRFSLLGFALDDRRLRAAGVSVSGRYRDADAVALLQRLDADLVWLPSTCPETFSYTLSIALSAGVPVCAFDIGAIAARLRRLGRAEGLVSLALADRPAALNGFLLTMARHGSARAAAAVIG